MTGRVLVVGGGTAGFALEGGHARDLEIQAAIRVSFCHAWLDPDTGKVFCLSSGLSKEAIMRLH